MVGGLSFVHRSVPEGLRRSEPTVVEDDYSSPPQSPDPTGVP